MKKISIFVFIIISIFTPLFFASAEISLVTKNITSNSAYFIGTGFAANSKYIIISTNKKDGSGGDQNVFTNQNGEMSVSLSILPESDYSIVLYDSTRKIKLIEKIITNKTNVALMKITGFTPAEGEPGSTVVINGENFSNVDKIFFGNEASIVGPISQTSVTTKVPEYAVTGKIKIQTKKDTIVTDFLSTNEFVVKIKEGTVVLYARLEDAIVVATDLISNSKEGTEVSQYPVGSISALKTVLENIKTDKEFIVKNSNGQSVATIQARVDKDVIELQTAIDAFKAKIVKSKTGNDTTKKSDLSSKGEGLIPECPPDGCSFNELMQLVNNVIKFLLFTIATPLAALGIVYAGWLYLSAGGNTENTTKAKKILTNIVVGYIIALAAWLIVNTILKSLGLDPSINTFLK